MCVRNEAWCVRASLTATLRWCDEAVVLVHASTDDTMHHVCGIADAHPGRVHIETEADPVWHEARYRQRTLDVARDNGATHMAIIDADELLTENLVPIIRERMRDMLPGEVIQPPWLQCWRSLDQYRDDDSEFGRAFASFVFRDSPELEWPTDGEKYDIHRRHPPTMRTATPWGSLTGGGVLHLQHANWRRVVAKQNLYRLTEVIRFGLPPREINERYSYTTDETGLHTSPVPREWWGRERALVEPDAVPWQGAEVKRLIELHGAEKFAGIEISGVA